MNGIDEHILNHIERLKENIEDAERTRREEQAKKIGSVIEKHIKKQDMVMFSDHGIAQIDSEYVPKSSQIRVYTGSNNRKLCIDIANELYKANHPFVRMFQVSKFTIDIQVEFVSYLRTVSLPDHIFDKLKKHSSISLNRFNVMAPDLQRVFIYKDFITPRSTVSEWKMRCAQLTVLNEKYPLDSGDTFPEQRYFQSKNDDLQKLNKFIQNRKDIIVTGNVGYNLLMNSIGKKEYTVGVTTLSLMSNEPNKIIDDIKKIVNITKEKTYRAPFNLHQGKTTLYQGKERIVEIYNMKNDCIPFNVIKGVQVVNYHGLMFTFHLEMHEQSGWDNREFIVKKMRTNIKFLKRARNEYLYKEAGKNDGDLFMKIGLEDGPMKVFHQMCLGEQMIQAREQLIDKWEGKVRLQGYNPEDYARAHNGELLVLSNRPKKGQGK